MVSHSATIGRRLRELFIRNPRTRKTFPGTAGYYKRLSAAFTSDDRPNPFFYVSSSEWNLYDYLLETFRFNRFRSEEHTSELQSLMRTSYAVFCLKKKTKCTPHQQ